MRERSFLRRCRQATRLTPGQAVERLRVEAARQLLTGASLPLKRIADRRGSAWRRACAAASCAYGTPAPGRSTSASDGAQPRSVTTAVVRSCSRFGPGCEGLVPEVAESPSLAHLSQQSSTSVIRSGADLPGRL